MCVSFQETGSLKQEGLLSALSPRFQKLKVFCLSLDTNQKNERKIKGLFLIFTPHLSLS